MDRRSFLNSVAALPVTKMVPQALAQGSTGVAPPIIGLLGRGFKALLPKLFDAKIDNFKIDGSGLVEVFCSRNMLGESGFSMKKFTTLRVIEETDHNVKARLLGLLAHLEKPGVLDHVREETLDTLRAGGWWGHCDVPHKVIETAFGTRQVLLAKRHDAMKEILRTDDRIRWNLGRKERDKFDAEFNIICSRPVEPLTNAWVKAEIDKVRLLRKYERHSTPSILECKKRDIFDVLKRWYERRFRSRKWNEYHWYQHLGMLQVRYARYSPRFRKQMHLRWTRELATNLRIKEVIMNAAMQHWNDKPERTDGTYSNWRFEKCMRVYRRVDDIGRIMGERFGSAVPLKSLLQRIVDGENVESEVADAFIVECSKTSWYDSIADLQKKICNLQAQLTKLRK